MIPARSRFDAMTSRIAGPIAGLFMLAAWAVPSWALDIDVADFKLANGMEVVVIPDHRAPVVTHMVWYKVGSADEPQGKSGIAHFLEHLLFKGTAKYPAGEFSRLIRLNGGEENAFTTRDYTGYFQRIELVMELEADRMQNLVLTDENVLPELLVVQEERRERTDGDPSSLLGEQLEAAMYTAHPYGRPVIGWMSEVMQLTRQDAVDYYKAHYTPANAVLVVAGDVTAEEVKILAEKYYGGLKNGFEPTIRKRTAEPAPIAARRVIMKDARAASPIVQRSYLAPSYSTATGNEATALEMLAEILGGGTQSRLYRKLVIERKLAAYTGAWYSGDALDYGSFGLYGAPNPGTGLDKVELAIDEVIADVVKNGVTREELDRTRAKLLADTVYTLDSQATLARMFGTALTTGSTAADVLGWESKIEKLTAADIQKAAAGVLRIEASVTGQLIPEPSSSQN
jgi:zinc protease